MKGLLIKDYKTVITQGKFLLLIYLFYTVFAAVTGNFSMLGTMSVIFCAIMPITAMAYDERSKWDKFSITLPVSRKTVVFERYLFGLTLIIPVILIGSVLEAVFTEAAVRKILSSAALSVSLGLIMMSLILPLTHKFGVEKGRLVMMVVIFSASIAASAFADRLRPESLPGSNKVAAGILLLSAVLFTASFYLSAYIYEKKEF